MPQYQQSNPWYYKITYFVVANQVVFKRFLVVALILINIFIWWPASVKLVNYISGGSKQKVYLNQLTSEQIDWQSYRQINRPQDLIIGSAQKIRNTNDSYNFLVQVKNPNPKWYVEKITYVFVADGKVTQEKSTFIMPEDQKYLMYFNFPSHAAINQVSFRLIDIKWKRVVDTSLNGILDDFNVENSRFDVDNNYSQINFEAKNQTNFDFYNVGFQVVLYRGSRAYASGYITAQDFYSGEKRQIYAGWPQNLSAPDDVAVEADVNFFDEDVFITKPQEKPVNLIKGAQNQR